MHGIKVWSDDVTTTYTDRQFYPGTLRVQHEVEVHEDARDVGNPAATFTPYGEREWVFVYNGSGATISAGTVVVRDGTNPWNGKAAAGTEVAGNVLGIAQHDIADGSYGWVLRKGVGYAIPTAAIADGASFLAASGGIGPTAGTAGESDQVLGAVIDGGETGSSLAAVKLDLP